MSNVFRVLIAYDGSPSANAMLETIPALGLPGDVEARVATVAERWLPPPSMYEIETAATPPGGIGDAQARAAEAERKVRQVCPSWTTGTVAHKGSPARLILQEAREWGANLLVMGAVGHSALARLVIGSVSYKLANEAPCSVCVVRAPSSPRNQLLIGFDASHGAHAAVAAVAGRHWTDGTRATLVMATGPGTDEAAHEQLGAARTMLEAAGLAVSTVILAGDPKLVLVDQAAELGADCIFVGANEHPMLERFLLGTVSGALVGRAPCSVEIVR